MVGTRRRSLKGYKAKKQKLSGEARALMELLRPTAIRCIAEMLQAKPTFNYREELIALLVPLMNDKDTRVSLQCCEAAAALFAKDPLGEVWFLSHIVECFGSLYEERVDQS